MLVSFRAVVVALVVLAASPVTAPFSTCGLADLFGEGSTPSPVAIKAPPAKDLPTLTPVLQPAAAVCWCGQAWVRDAGPVAAAIPQRSRPLRI